MALTFNNEPFIHAHASQFADLSFLFVLYCDIRFFFVSFSLFSLGCVLFYTELQKFGFLLSFLACSHSSHSFSLAVSLSLSFSLGLARTHAYTLVRSLSPLLDVCVNQLPDNLTRFLRFFFILFVYIVIITIFPTTR